MKTTVEIGYGYALRSEMGGEVANAETGKTLETLEPNKQVHMTAQEPEWDVPDDCQVTKMRNFNHALAVAGLLGGGADKLPAGYTRVEFLESTGTQRISVARTLALSENCRFSFKAQNTGGTGWQHAFGARVAANTKEFGVTYNASGNSAQVGLGGGIVSIPCAVTGVHEITADGAKGTVVCGTETRAIASAASAMTSIGVFQRTGVYTYFTGRIFKASIYNNGQQILQLVPALNPAGEPCMYDLVTREPYRNVGSGQFVTGMTLAQVRGLRLLAGGGKLTLALPHEASIDRQAQAALERERANGWELTLQYAEAEVPAGYRKLEYLESTGSQYVNIARQLTIATDCAIVYEAQNTGGTGHQHAFGARVAANAKEFGVSYNLDSSRANIMLGGGAGVSIPCEVTAPHKIIADGAAGTVVCGDETRSITASTITMSSIGVFCRSGIAYSYFIGRICKVSIFNEGQQFLQLVPAIGPTGKLCMYDRVSGTAYQGVGTFAAGLATVADVRNLWLPATGGSITLSVPHDTPESAVVQLRANYPNWQIAIQYRES